MQRLSEFHAEYFGRENARGNDDLNRAKTDRFKYIREDNRSGKSGGKSHK